MRVYLDSSVILRYVLQQPGLFPNWGKWEKAYTSEICRVEGCRAIDRARREGRISDEALAECVVRLEESLRRVDEIELDRKILRRASQSFPTIIGTLDAIHVAAALFWQEEQNEDLHFLTHDNQQGITARALGLKSLGF
ncbi:MAG: type II toxin-antitoxin system VapC family toxin [Deltaproteobacteria bacterium]|nr:type II toxin-antitoxin system VapC family toxin [Deltaproteobacteria bacterium]